MSHYIIAGDAFEQAYDKLATTGWKLNLESAHRPGTQKAPNSKVKFTCSNCGQNAWGKPDLAILCKPCKVQMRDWQLKSYDRRDPYETDMRMWLAHICLMILPIMRQVRAYGP